MTAKKVLVFVGVLIFGTVVTAVIDGLLGISFKDVSPTVAITHRVMYTAWGAVYTGTILWLVGIRLAVRRDL